MIYAKLMIFFAASSLMFSSLYSMDALQITLRELVHKGDVHKLESFLAQQVDPAALINARDYYGRTALFWAKDVATAQLLVRYGAYLNDNNFDFGYPRADPILLFYNFPQPRELFGPRPQANAVQIFGPTPTTEATAFYTPSTYPPGTYIPETLEQTPYTPSIYKPVKYAPGIYPSNIHVPAGAKVPYIKPMSEAKKSALRIELARLCAIADAQAVEQLILSFGTDHPEEIINAKDDYGRSAIFFTNNYAVAKILIKYGANLDVQDFEGKKPLVVTEQLKILYFPTYRQNMATFQDQFYPTQDDLKAYVAKVIPPAVVPGELTTAQKIIRNQDYLSSQRHKVKTLTAAIAHGAAEKDIQKDVVNPVVYNILRDQELDVNRTYVVVPNLGKVRPIHVAVLYGDRALIQYLLNRGASVNSFTERGLTPLDLVDRGLTAQTAYQKAAIRSYLTTLEAGRGSASRAAEKDAFEWNWLDL